LSYHDLFTTKMITQWPLGSIDYEMSLVC